MTSDGYNALFVKVNVHYSIMWFPLSLPVIFPNTWGRMETIRLYVRSLHVCLRRSLVFWPWNIINPSHPAVRGDLMTYLTLYVCLTYYDILFVLQTQV